MSAEISTTASPRRGCDGPPLLVAEHVVKQFWSAVGPPWRRSDHVVTAVDDVSLEVRSGETLGIAGQSGSGKTTLGRCLARLCTLTSGTITFDGVDISASSRRDLRPLRRHVQTISQDPSGALNPARRVGSIIADPIRIHGIEDGRNVRRHVQQMMEMVGLNPEHYNRFPAEFSGGQQQRICIARALAPRPKLIVCDEPVSRLDVSIQAQIVNLLADLQGELNVSYILIAHDLSMIRHVSDRVAVIHHGQVVEMADVDELYGRPQHPQTIALLSAAPTLRPPGVDRRERLAPATCASVAAPGAGNGPTSAAAESKTGATTSSEVPGRSAWQLAARRLRRDRTAVASLLVIALVVGWALAAPLIALAVGHPPNQQYHETGQTAEGLPVGPRAEFWLGTDDLGRDLLVRIGYGLRVSLIVAVAASLSALAIGVVVGMVAGYFGGVVDTLLARLADVLLALPFLLFAIALVSVAGPSLILMTALIAMFSWASAARLVRGQVLSIREKDYLQAAWSMGSGDRRIIFVDVLPNIMAPAIVYVTLLMPAVIVLAASLSFLGLGTPPPTADLGAMLASSVTYYRQAWWYLAFPTAALLLITIALNMFGDSLRDAFDPHADRLARSAGRQAPC